MTVQLRTIEGEAVAADATNAHSWRAGNALTIAGEKFIVRVNPATVVSLAVPGSIMAGFPVSPTVQLEFATNHSSVFRLGVVRLRFVGVTLPRDCALEAHFDRPTFIR